MWGCRRGCILTPNPRRTQDTGTKVGEQGPDGSADQSAPPTGDVTPPTGDTPAPGRRGPALGRQTAPPMGDSAPPT